jgi:hypothetical protein
MPKEIVAPCVSPEISTHVMGMGGLTNLRYDGFSAGIREINGVKRSCVGFNVA